MTNERQMTYRDYLNWADEYRGQAKVIDQKIEQRRKRRAFKSADERSEFERGTMMFREMLRDCRITEAKLLEKAQQIKEAEEHKTNHTNI